MISRLKRKFRELLSSSSAYKKIDGKEFYTKEEKKIGNTDKNEENRILIKELEPEIAEQREEIMEEASFAKIEVKY
jgi:hypothetical protein